MSLSARLAVVAALLLVPSVAKATDRKACIGAFEETQRLRTQNKLISAREQLAICTDPACPPLVRKNCTEWMGELSSLIPSLVFALHGDDGEDHADGAVSMDGTPITVQLGQPLSCDPGVHHLRFEVPGYLPFEQDVVVTAGEQNRRLDIMLHRPELPPAAYPVAPPPPPPPPKQNKWLAPALGGAGVGFLALGLVGVVTTSSTLGDMRRTCAPACNPSDISTLNLRYGLSGVSFGLGAIAIGAAVWFFTHPVRSSSTVGALEPRIVF